MKKKETAEILAILNATYPQVYAKLTPEIKETMLNIWFEMFSNTDYEVVIMAVKNYISNDTKGFMPTIGAIKESIRKLQHPETLTEQEAVNMIMESLNDGYYNSKGMFDKLPKILQRVVGSPAQLAQWSIMEIDTVQSVVASNIARSYRAILEQEQEKQKSGYLYETKIKQLGETN
jgi:hypothetical protein